MKSPSRRGGAQRGATLIITLVMLVLITLLSVSTLRTTTLDERMAGNARDRERALQAAETAVLACLAQLDAGTYPVAPVAPAAIGAQQHWDIATNWNDGSPNSYEIAMTDAGLVANPRCIAEALGAAGSYRVTAKAVGGATESVVMLQATYSKE